MKAHDDLHTLEAIQGWLVDWAAAELDLDPMEIDPHQAFLSYGMDSMHAMMLVGDLEGKLGTRLSPTLAWDYPTINDLARHVVEEVASLRTAESVSPAVQPGRVIPSHEPDAAAILSQLDGMSEEDMDSLLEQYLDAPR
jgi:acyl carrier protein